MRDRVARIQAELKNLEVDVAIVLSPENVRYVSGYYGFTQSTRAVVIPASGEAVLVVVESDVTLARKTTDLPVEVYPLNGRGLVKLAGVCSRIARERKIGILRWAVEFEQITLGVHEILREQLGVSKFVDLSPTFLSHRSIKGAEEVVEFRRAAQLAVTGMREGLRCLAAGTAETVIKATVDRSIFAEAASRWKDAVIESQTNVVSGTKMDRLHAMATGRKVAAGEVAFMIGSVSCNGYWANIARTLVVDGEQSVHHLPPALVVVQRAQRSAFDVLRPKGTLAAAVDAADRVLDEAGLRGRKIYPMFRGLGLSTAERPGLADLDRPIEPGMCMCLQLYVTQPDAIVGVSDSVIITGSGPELLTAEV